MGTLVVIVRRKSMLGNKWAKSGNLGGYSEKKIYARQ